MTVTEEPTVAVENLTPAYAGQPTLTVADIDVQLRQRSGDGPTVVPPQEQAQSGASNGLTAWHQNQKITAMWANSATRNAYASVQGMGWRRVSSANDSSFVTLVALLGHAEQTDANCRLRIEADDEIHEVYVF